MERSETLRRLRGEFRNYITIGEKKIFTMEDAWANRAQYFPSAFIEKTPENAQRLVLWCLAPDPAQRPTAQELSKVRANLR
jgi:hypothetical protein